MTRLRNTLKAFSLPAHKELSSLANNRRRHSQGLCISVAIACIWLVNFGGLFSGVRLLWSLPQAPKISQQHVLLGDSEYQNDLTKLKKLWQNWPLDTPKACIVTLCRNSELEDVLSSMKDMEHRFNSRHGYPYIFLNDKQFSQNFRDTVRAATNSKTFFGLVPQEHWSIPPNISEQLVYQHMLNMDDDILYGKSISYRHMCRYFSGFFMQHPLLLGFDLYWRMEPGINFYCDINPDPFRLLMERNISYGFNIMVPEDMRTIPSLFPMVQGFIEAYPKHIHTDNTLRQLLKKDEETGHMRYTGCHFWSNFEIGSLNWLRSDAYQDYFRYLDESGNFFYERWGDAPVHSLAAVLTLPRDGIHFFKNIGYRHDYWKHCPKLVKDRNNCDCDPAEDVNIYDEQARECLEGYVGL